MNKYRIIILRESGKFVKEIEFEHPLKGFAELYAKSNMELEDLLEQISVGYAFLGLPSPIKDRITQYRIVTVIDIPE